MTDPRNQKRVEVRRREGGGGSFSLLSDRVPEARAVLDQHGVPYWMDDIEISSDGGPYISRLVLSVKADLDLVQRLLDTLP
ncbi:MAG: hypothetical protein C0501_06305 [Isosphaera sp.]|nr:hypothetical protein [Isosphaera sp.]